VVSNGVPNLIKDNKRKYRNRLLMHDIENFLVYFEKSKSEKKQETIKRR